MIKKRRGSSARGAPVGKNEKGMKSKKIDFSDIPELSDKQLSSMRRVARPTVGNEPRKLTAIRFDAKFGVGYARATRKKATVPVVTQGNIGQRDAEGKLTKFGKSFTHVWQR